VIDEKRVLYKAAMTPDQIADAIVEKNLFKLTMIREPDSCIEHILVYLSLYKEVLRCLGLSEGYDTEEESKEDLEQIEGFVRTFARLADGRFVEIAVEFGDLVRFSKRDCNEPEFILDYRTKFDLGENVQFIDLLLPLEAGMLLEGQEFFSIETN